MPAAIGAAAAAAIGAGAIGSAVITAAISIAFSFVSQALLGKPKVPSQKPPAGRMNMRQEPAPPRQRIYGRVKVSGPLGMIRERDEGGGSDKDILHLAVLLAGHEIDAVESYWADAREVTVDGNGAATDSYYRRGSDVFMHVWHHLGAVNQAADPVLVNDLADWTTDHRLRGIAYLHVKLDHRDWQTGQKVYASGVPQMRAIVRGAKVYDPREAGHDPDDPSTWEYSDNAALCVADFMHLPREEGGLGIPWSKIDMDALIAAADRCDEEVALLAGGTEKRYTCNGAWELDERPLDVLRKLLSSMAGTVVWTGGVWKIHAGGWDAPTLTLTEDDLRADVVVDDATDMFSEINSVRGTFFSPDRHWQPTDFPPFQNADYVEEDGGDELWRDVSWDFTTSAATAQRLAKIELERNRRGKTIRFPAKITVLPVDIHEVVYVTLPRFGWNKKTFRVESWKLVAAQGLNGNEGFAVDLVLREEDASMWAWDAATEEQEFEVAPPAEEGSSNDVQPPENAEVVALDAETIWGDNIEIFGRAQVSWTAPADSFVERYLVTWEAPGSEEVLGGQQFVSSSATSYIVTGLRFGIPYTFGVQSYAGGGARSEVVEPAGSPLTVDSDDGAPEAPTNVVASDGGSVVDLTWHNPPESDFRRVQVWRSTTNDSGTATMIKQVYGLPDKPDGWTDESATSGTFYYWLKAEDFAGNASAFSMGVSVTL